jgi:hypothetical protein
MNTSRTQTALDDFESSARAKNHVARWYSNILEGNVTMSVGSIIITVNGQHSLDLDTRSIGWHQDN